MAAKLKPCPFCGFTFLTMQQGMGEFWVKCNCCKAGTEMKGNEVSAAMCWNRRQDTKEAGLTTTNKQKSA